MARAPISTFRRPARIGRLTWGCEATARSQSSCGQKQIWASPACKIRRRTKTTQCGQSSLEEVTVPCAEGPRQASAGQGRPFRTQEAAVRAKLFPVPEASCPVSESQLPEAKALSKKGHRREAKQRWREIVQARAGLSVHGWELARSSPSKPIRMSVTECQTKHACVAAAKGHMLRKPLPAIAGQARPCHTQAWMDLAAPGNEAILGCLKTKSPKLAGANLAARDRKQASGTRAVPSFLLPWAGLSLWDPAPTAEMQGMPCRTQKSGSRCARDSAWAGSCQGRQGPGQAGKIRWSDSRTMLKLSQTGRNHAEALPILSLPSLMAAAMRPCTLNQRLAGKGLASRSLTRVSYCQTLPCHKWTSRGPGRTFQKQTRVNQDKRDFGQKATGRCSQSPKSMG